MKSPPTAPHEHGPRTSVQLSAKTWPLFDRLFAANNGVWGGCWCAFYHIPGDFDASAYSKNRRSKMKLVIERKAHGTIVLCGDEPVGWCQFGPREELPRIDAKKGYTPTSKDAWRITCFFISKGHRRQGLGRFALDESIGAMKKLGVRSIEAYPVEGKLAAAMLWSGTPELFEGAGFSRVGPLGKRSWIYSLRIQ
jgi:GNAT superfamily N-acetyltransferase